MIRVSAEAHAQADDSDHALPSPATRPTPSWPSRPPAGQTDQPGAPEPPDVLLPEATASAALTQSTHCARAGPPALPRSLA